jgi:hypothetical protein
LCIDGLRSANKGINGEAIRQGPSRRTKRSSGCSIRHRPGIINNPPIAPGMIQTKPTPPFTNRAEEKNEGQIKVRLNLSRGG